MKNVYVVTISRGQWSDHSDTLSAVFTDKAMAEKYCEQIKAHYNVEIPVDPPYLVDDYIEEKLTEEQVREYETWNNANSEQYDFNSAYITEITLDFPEQRFLTSTLKNEFQQPRQSVLFYQYYEWFMLLTPQP